MVSKIYRILKFIREYLRNQQCLNKFMVTDLIIHNSILCMMLNFTIIDKCRNNSHPIWDLSLAGKYYGFILAWYWYNFCELFFDNLYWILVCFWCHWHIWTHKFLTEWLILWTYIALYVCALLGHLDYQLIMVIVVSVALLFVQDSPSWKY